MNMKKNQHQGFSKLFAAAAIVVLIAAIYSRTASGPAQPTCDEGQSAKTTISVLDIQEDSLKSLLNHFFWKNNLTNSSFDITGELFHLKLEEFADNMISFYNNPNLINSSGEGFIVQKATDGGLDCSFKRKKIAGQHYTVVPADILFRLFKSKI